MVAAEHVGVVVVESILCAAYIALFVVALVLCFNRRSYKVLLLFWSQFSFLVPKRLADKQSTKKLLREVEDKSAVDILVSGLLLFTLFRAASEALRVASFALRAPTPAVGIFHATPLDLASTAVFMLGFAFYNILFICLAWMWLKVALVLFSHKSKKCVSWTVGILLCTSAVLMLIPILAVMIMHLIPDFGTTTAYSVSIIIGVVIFFISQILLTVIISSLAIKIGCLMKVAKASSCVENEVEERKLKLVIKKVTVAILCFIGALLFRAAGVGAVVLRNAIPIWAVSVFFMGIPELIGCLAVVYVLWPYSCIACRRFSKAPKEDQTPTASQAATELQKQPSRRQFQLAESTTSSSGSPTAEAVPLQVMAEASAVLTCNISTDSQDANIEQVVVS